MTLGGMIEGQEVFTWQHLSHVAQLSERFGYESLWRSDHLQARRQL